MALSVGTTYTITITSDIVCPWCYIGHARLTKAITQHQKQYPSDKFNLTYRPFYLNPPPQPSILSGSTSQSAAFPTPTQPRRQYYASKFGAQRAQQIFQRLGQAAAEDGLDFKFGGVVGHPRNGHRLVYHAQQSKPQQTPANESDSPQNKVLKALWRAYFETETDITDLEVLTEIGVNAGLGSAEAVREYLVSGRDLETVDSLADESRGDGIMGVPYYEVSVGEHDKSEGAKSKPTGRKWVVEGAQTPDVFESVFLQGKQK